MRKKGTMDESPDDFTDPETPARHKKRLASQMAKQYNPASVEKSCVLFLH
jgi:valyl-tRNA synthetase